MRTRGSGVVCPHEWDEYRLYNAHAAAAVEGSYFVGRHFGRESDSFTEDTLDLLSKPSLTEKRLVLLWEAHHVDSRLSP